jgi:radical SAM superfamily enzyme
MVQKSRVPGLDVCVSSQTGTDPVDLESWQQEFERCIQKISSGTDAQLFSAAFSNVPSTERLADWLTTKWATAVLRTYDIAAIRVGARPVCEACSVTAVECLARVGGLQYRDGGENDH